MVNQISKTLDILPQAAQQQIQGTTPEARTAFALAVFLFAPVAVVVPLTISTAVGAATLVGERERGTGEFLAHSPATVREIYLGKLIASLVPGYFTTIVGFGLYSLVVNLDRRPLRRRLVLPDEAVVDPDVLGDPAVPGLHAVARVATLGPGEVDGSRATGLGPRHACR